MPDAIKILVADDNIELSNLLIDFFAHADRFAVVGAAHSGLQAVELVKLTAPDVMLLDITLPELDGLGVLEQLRKLPPESRPLFILLSALWQENAARIAMELGADYLLTKPFDFQVLAARIRQLYRLKHARQEAGGAAGQEGEGVRARIRAVLLRMGVPDRLKGFAYLEYASEIILDEPTALNNLHRKVYERISQKFGTTPARVERAIRNAIEQTFYRGDPDYLRSIFGASLHADKIRPSNSEFINILTSEVRARHSLLSRSAARLF